MAATKHVVIARTIITKDVDIRPEPLEEIEVVAGEPFTVGMTYRLYEESADRDEWRFRLETRLDEDTQTNEAVVQDRAWSRDDQWANLANEHVIESPGRHTLHFTLHGSLARSDWGGGPASLVAQADEQGSVTIIAR